MTNDNHRKTTDGGPGTYFDPKGTSNIGTAKGLTPGTAKGLTPVVGL